MMMMMQLNWICLDAGLGLWELPFVEGFFALPFLLLSLWGPLNHQSSSIIYESEDVPAFSVNANENDSQEP